MYHYQQCWLTTGISESLRSFNWFAWRIFSAKSRSSLSWILIDRLHIISWTKETITIYTSVSLHYTLNNSQNIKMPYLQFCTEFLLTSNQINLLENCFCHYMATDFTLTTWDSGDFIFTMPCRNLSLASWHMLYKCYSCNYNISFIIAWLEHSTSKCSQWKQSAVHGTEMDW